MGSISKRKIPISNKDLKKAVVNANKKLESKNKSLEKSIKDQKGQLKSLDKEYSSEANKLRKLLIDVEFNEERLQKIQGGVYSTDKLLKTKLDAVSSAEKDAKSYEKKALKQEEKERKLRDEIAQLEFYKKKLESSKVELAGIQVKKDNALGDVALVKSEISKIKADGESMVANYNQAYNDYEVEIEKRQEFAKRLENTLSSTKDEIAVERGRLDSVRKIMENEKNIADNELQAVKNLTNDTEDKYIEWGQKIVKITEKADKEEDRIKKTKERYEKWRIGVLEEVARMKLKKKVDNIDKAGLSEILNG
jgi:DNA repair exonuclease SbcCD ATPase subunit